MREVDEGTQKHVSDMGGPSGIWAGLEQAIWSGPRGPEPVSEQ